MGEWKGPQGSQDRSGGKGLVKPPRMLSLMHRVVGQPESEDSTEGERQCRVLLKECPEEFLKQMGELERLHLQSKAKNQSDRSKAQAKLKPPTAQAPQEPQATPQGPADPGTVRVVELIDRLLGEWEGQSAGTAGGTR